MGNKRITIEEIKQRIFRIHGDSVIIVEDTYERTDKRATFIHKEAGPWRTFVGNVFNGSTHPKIALKNKTISLNEIKKRILEIHGDLVSIKEDTYINTHKKATFIHKHEGEWEALVYNVLNGLSHTNFRPKLLTKNEVENKIKKIHGDKIKIIWDSFINTQSSAKFVDEHGEFESLVNNILMGQGSYAGKRDKTIKTNIDRYGVSSPMKNKEIVMKSVKSQTKSTIKTHWKTGEELVCQASWEPKVVDCLNDNKIDYLWQPKSFETPVLTLKGNKSTYRPDIFLIDSNTWVEIKGYFRKDALEKWEWFKTQFPTAELWDKKKLKEMGIL